MATYYRCMGGSSKPKDNNLYIVKNGIVENFILSPTTNTGSGRQYSKKAPTMSFQNDSIKITNDNGYAGDIDIFPMIDLTEYKTVKISVKSTRGTFNLTISKSIANNYSFVKSVSLPSSGSGTYSIDVSDLSGEYYLILYTGDTETYLTDMWLEPAEKTYLYKDGVQNVAWDNDFKFNASVTSDGGWTFNENNATANVTVAQHSRGMVTNKAIDLSEYSKIKFIYGATNAGEIDISSLNISAYIMVGAYYTSNKGFTISVLNDKNGYNEGANRIVTTSATVTLPITLNRIWLEK